MFFSINFINFFVFSIYFFSIYANAETTFKNFHFFMSLPRFNSTFSLTLMVKEKRSQELLKGSGGSKGEYEQFV